jgi:hypothetical protein
MSAAPSADLESLRAEIAAARGLGADAVSFLDGSTLAEIEAQADALAKVIGTSARSRRTRGRCRAGSVHRRGGGEGAAKAGARGDLLRSGTAASRRVGPVRDELRRRRTAADPSCEVAGEGARRADRSARRPPTGSKAAAGRASRAALRRERRRRSRGRGRDRARRGSARSEGARSGSASRPPQASGISWLWIRRTPVALQSAQRRPSRRTRRSKRRRRARPSTVRR